jgi:hypothetical protein
MPRDMTAVDKSAMHRASPKALAEYLILDPVAGLLDSSSRDADETLTCQKWLRSTPAKRYSAHILYGDLLETRGRRILDIGGGLSSLTRILAERHSYTLVDLMAHDAPKTVAAFVSGCAPFDLIASDWASSMPDAAFDVVIAADLFPNVDQRFENFLTRALAIASEVRVSLTWHDPPRQDLVRRMHGDEIMCMVGWSGRQIMEALERVQPGIAHYDPGVFGAGGGSIYPNGRQVCYASIHRGAIS